MWAAEAHISGKIGFRRVTFLFFNISLPHAVTSKESSLYSVNINFPQHKIKRMRLEEVIWQIPIELDFAAFDVLNHSFVAAMILLWIYLIFSCCRETGAQFQFRLKKNCMGILTDIPITGPFVIDKTKTISMLSCAVHCSTLANCDAFSYYPDLSCETFKLGLAGLSILNLKKCSTFEKL